MSNNYFIITGCSSYSAATQNDYSVELANVKNKGYVQGTTSFTVQLYATDSSGDYPIAQMNSGLTLPDSEFSSDIVRSLAISAVDTAEIQKNTRYKISVLPTNDMASSSKISVKFPSSITLYDGSCTVSTTGGGIDTSASC